MSPEAQRMEGEMFFAKRLHDHGAKVFAGVTDPDERRERIRFTIIECALDCVIFGKNREGKTETYAQAFERFYGEPLEPKQPRKGKTNAQSRSA